MDKKDNSNNISFPPYFTAWRFVSALLLLALSIRFSIAGYYNKMAVAAAGALFGPAQWVLIRDQLKTVKNPELDVSNANRWLIFAICVTGAGLAYFQQEFLIASLTVLAGFGQFWFKTDINSGERMWHGFSATIVALIGFMTYRPLMYICLPLSLLFALDYVRLQRQEKAEMQQQSKRKTKKKRRKK